MFDFSSLINLPLIWGLLIAIAVLLYVLMDGFDLGIGILLPFAPSDKCRDHMISSIAPFWDGNETWLVLGGGGLFAAFPLAYSILMPAFYIPIIIMLLGLIVRGVSFEFRFKAEGKYRQLWDYAFHFGSLGAAFCQGMILGAFIHGVEVNGRNFSGGQFDWASAFSVMTGIAVVRQEVLGEQLVKIQHKQSLANSLEQTTMLHEVTSVIELVGWTMQGTTKVKGLSSEIPEDIEVDIFMAMEDSMKDNVKASYHSLYRDLRPCHVLKWTSSELGRSYAFLQRYAGTSQQRQELAEDAGEVGLIDSTQNVGKPRTRGSDQQYSNWNRDC